MSIPLRRRSKVDRRHLRISFPNHFEAEGARRCAYLVRMIKPNLIVSHDWHIQPSCQRSFRTVRLSGALLDRGLPLRTGVLELNALLVFRSCLRSPAFLREPFEGIQLSPSCQRESGVTPLVRAPRNALRKISKNDQQKILVPLGRAKGFPFRVLQSMVLFGLSSAGFPTGAQGRDQRFHLYPNEPASHFPQRAGHTATGRLHCCLCNFSRVTQVTQVCKRRQTAPCSRLRLPENTNPSP